MNVALEHEHSEARQVSCRHKCSSECLSRRAHISRHDGVTAQKYMARMAILDTKPALDCLSLVIQIRLKQMAATDIRPHTSG